MKYNGFALTGNPNIDHETQACLRIWAACMYTGIAEAAEAFKQQKLNSPERRWFESDRHDPGSFNWLCELFNIDPSQARSAARMRFRDIVRNAKPKA